MTTEEKSPFFTTGKIAKMLRTSPKTVQNWIDSGMMKGHILPGRRELRRVERQDLIDFIVAKKLPMPDELKGEIPQEPAA